MAADHLDRLAAKLSVTGVRSVSPDIVPLPGEASGKAPAVLDPDGHRVLLLQY